MLILVDSKLPLTAKQKLQYYGEVVDFSTQNITYDAISGHPDIFFCPTPNGLIVAPNLPEKYQHILHTHNIHFNIGINKVGAIYPKTIPYNTLVTSKIIVHHKNTIEPSIVELHPYNTLIPVNQGYIRCNLLDLPNNSFICSDKGICKSLNNNNLNVLYVNPLSIALHNFSNGFFGGICGKYKHTLFIAGSLKYIPNYQQIYSFIEESGMQIVELFDGQPIDVGTILFL